MGRKDNKERKQEKQSRKSLRGLPSEDVRRSFNEELPTPKKVPKRVIDEQHRDYELMYDMLNGIRTVVGQISSKPTQEVKLEDFREKTKLRFTRDGSGSLVTPTLPNERYDFKFKDYCPLVFRHLREHFHMDAADYLMSLTDEYILREMKTNSHSGSFFFYSSDMRFIIKTLTKYEAKFFFSILPQYHQHVSQNPNTLIARFYGLHRVKSHRRKQTYFTVMGNSFPVNYFIHEKYDLKGSYVNRYTTPEERKAGAVMKDMDFNKAFSLGPKKSRLLLEQIDKDANFLASLKVMDYSLLVGIHYPMFGNFNKPARQRSLSVLFHHPSLPAQPPSPSVSPLVPQTPSSTVPRPLDRSSPSLSQPTLSTPTPKSARPRHKTVLSTNDSQLQEAVQPQSKTAIELEPLPAPSALVPDASDNNAQSSSDPGQKQSRPPSNNDGNSNMGLEVEADGPGMYQERALSSVDYSLPIQPAIEQTHSVFQQDGGGFSATNEFDVPIDGGEIYFLSVIDFFQPYNTKKRLEHTFKSLKYDRNGISAVDPLHYAQRFRAFISGICIGGGAEVFRPAENDDSVFLSDTGIFDVRHEGYQTICKQLAELHPNVARPSRKESQTLSRLESSSFSTTRSANQSSSSEQMPPSLAKLFRPPVEPPSI